MADLPAVLLADPDEQQFALCAAYFPLVGFDLVHAGDAGECLALVRSRRPVAILIALGVGDEPRVEDLLDTLRELGVDPARSVLLLTEGLRPGERAPRLVAQVAGTIAKPCPLVTLVSSVRRLVLMPPGFRPVAE